MALVNPSIKTAISSTPNAVPKYTDDTATEVTSTEVIIDDSNNLVVPGNLTLDQIATPANPDAGTGKIYFKSNGHLHALAPDGTETDLQAASGDFTQANALKISSFRG